MYGGQSSEGFLVDHHHPINDVQKSGFLCASPKENHTMMSACGGGIHYKDQSVKDGLVSYGDS